jgi:ribose 5-phosphate isomerase A
MSEQEKKQRAATAALDYLLEGTVLGIGTGSTVNCFIELLASRAHLVKGAVSSSDTTSARLKSAGIEVLDLNGVEEIPLYVDGADQANRRRHLIKGGGAALTREKIVAEASREYVCILDDSKLVDTLGSFGLPVEVIPMARELVARRLVALGGRPVWRQGLVTDNGNVILDVHGLAIEDPPALECEVNQIPGVVAVGLFARRPADLLLIGTDHGVERV